MIQVPEVKYIYLFIHFINLLNTIFTFYSLIISLFSHHGWFIIKFHSHLKSTKLTLQSYKTHCTKPKSLYYQLSLKIINTSCPAAFIANLSKESLYFSGRINFIVQNYIWQLIKDNIFNI